MDKDNGGFPNTQEVNTQKKMWNKWIKQWRKNKAHQLWYEVSRNFVYKTWRYNNCSEKWNAENSSIVVPEAEIIAIVQCVQEMLYLMRLSESLHLKVRTPMIG